MKMRGLMLLLLAIAGLALLPTLAMAQSPADSGDSSSAVVYRQQARRNRNWLRRHMPLRQRKRGSTTTSSMLSAPIHSRGLRWLLALTRRTMPRPSGNKAPRVTASDWDPASASRR